jgi:hypothetical protein
MSRIFSFLFMRTRILALLILALFGGQALFSQNLESINSLDKGSGSYNSWETMQQYSVDVTKGFKKWNAPIYLHGVYHETIFKKIKNPQRIRLAYENALMMNTHNILAGYHPGKIGNFSVYLSGRVGWGYQESDYFLKEGTSGEVKAKINSSFGAELELENSFNNKSKSGLYNLNYFVGVGLNYVSPEKYNNSERNNGTVLDPFGGLRYYLINIKSGNDGEAHRIYLQAKVGLPMTTVSLRLDESASPVYVSFGAGITSLQSLSKLKDITLPDLFMLPETGFYVAPLGGVAYAQITQPIRIAGNLSLGVNGQIGTGISKAEKNKQQATSFWGVGADFRFFDPENNAFINPYLGIMFNNYGYRLNNEKEKGTVTFLRIGDKINLFKSNWYLDANIGVPLTTTDVWIENTSADKTIQDIPATIDFNIGLFYKFKSPKDRLTGKYITKHYIFDEDKIPLIEKATLPKKGPLPMDAEADSLLIETRVYIKQQIDTIFKVINDTIGIPMYPNIDVTNMRVGRYIDPTVRITTFDDWSVVPADTTSVSKEPVTLFLVGVDTRNSDPSMISDTNMFIVFNDLNRSRFFGFNYDSKNVMRPETGTGELNLNAKDPFYGNYDKFVIPLKWLDNSKYDVEDIQTRTSWKNDNYKIAYTEFDKALFEEVAKHCPDFGVSVLFNIKKNDGKTTQFLSNVLGGKRKFLSGVEKPIEPNYSDCVPVSIKQFGLSEDKLNNKNQKSVETVAKTAMFCKITRISGYTDGVDFKPDLNAKIDFMNEMQSFKNESILNQCPQLRTTWEDIISEWEGTAKTTENKAAMEKLCQKALAWRRIWQVLANLQTYEPLLNDNLDLSKLIVEPLGNENYQASNKQNPTERKVVVYFENSN